MPERICPFCGKPVDPVDPGNYQRIVGWERKRVQGGTNQVRLRETRDEFAHRLCVEMPQLRGQGGLFG